MKEHFEKIYRQREEKEEELGKYSGQEWGRPKENKWSWGETYYHLYLMMKWFRRLSKIYVPITKPVATLQRNKPYLIGSANVYEAYQGKNKKPMKAPFMLAELDKETKL